MQYFVILNIILISNVFSKNVHRDARFLRGSHTNTVIENMTITKTVPSSCVQVDATLPPCRSVRFLWIPNFTSNQTNHTADNREGRPEIKEETVESTPLSWGEYLGIYAHTVNTTTTNSFTITVKDPRVVVTYTVKGCRPRKLPSDLHRCPEETVSYLPVQGVLPTSTVSPISPTAADMNTQLIDLANVAAYGDAVNNDIQGNIQGSREDNENLVAAGATDPLP